MIKYNSIDAIKLAVTNNTKVYWANHSYTVTKNKKSGDYLIAYNTNLSVTALDDNANIDEFFSVET